MKKFKELSVSRPPIDLSKYIAHTTKCHVNETLEEHIENTHQKFLSLCNNGSIENIIDKEIKKIFEQDGSQNIIKQLILDVICLHDIGKINPSFQNKIKGEKVENEDSDHSKLGWLLFSTYYNNKLKEKLEDKDYVLGQILTTIIVGHHTSAYGIPLDGFVSKEDLSEKVDPIAKKANWDNFNVKDFPAMWYNEAIYNNGNHDNLSKLFMLYKTIYSALILSDSIATAEAVNCNAPKPDINKYEIIPEDIENWHKTFLDRDIMKKYKDLKTKIHETEINDIKDINSLRAKILDESNDTFNSSNSRLFYLEAPTGAGKTNCAINFIFNVLKADKSIKHSIFVFPFINLIEQNLQVLKDSIGAKSTDILEAHSLAGYETIVEDNGQILNEFIDQRKFLKAKISVITSVNFLESLGSSRKELNYKICNISNSVIVLDEIQSINDEHWPYVAFLLNKFSESNNCYILLMSATLPKIDKLLSEGYKSALDKNEFVDLIPKFVDLIPNFEKYQKHKCFKNRCKIDTESMKISTNEQLQKFIKNKISSMSLPMKLLVVVNTVKRAKEIFNSLKNDDNFKCKEPFEIKLLTSELLPHTKRQIIKKIKDKKYQRFILVSTQCIEAGIDVDFDIGIRDYAIPDSIEQVAGRINRENKSQNENKLYIINLINSEKSGKTDAEIIYGNDLRWRVLGDLQKENKINELFENRNYKNYYDSLINKLNENNKQGLEKTEYTILKQANALNLHDSIKNFHIIKNLRKQSYFIPVAIPINEFTDYEKKWLEAHHTSIDGDYIDGKKVWKIYEEIIKEPYNYIKMLEFSPILTHFISNKTLKPREKEERNVVLDEYDDFDLETGFKDSESIF